MNPDQLSQLNNMINNMNNVNICDAACQKQKKVNRLRVQYNNAKNKLSNAPAEIEATRKAYYLEDLKKVQLIIPNIWKINITRRSRRS